jgi:glycine betaine/choline ABC-type transport system substrate-binding protein/DNA-binding transcriptional LysR family regulator
MSAVVLGAFLAGCGEEPHSLRVGSKPFSESMILAEMIAQLAENEGIAVERHIPFGTTAQIMEATKQGVVDVYPEYNGTGLIFLGQAPTSDGEKSTEIVQRLFNPLGLEMSGKFGFSNDYAIVMTSERAQELRVASIGDLAATGRPLVFAVDEDFTKRPADGLPQLLRRYGITRSSTLAFPLGTEGKDKIVSALLDGSADVAELFVTDGQIAEYDLVVLEDDEKFFPVYEAAPLVRSEALNKLPSLSGVLAKLSGAITAADMQQMNKSVDLDAQTPASVASAFLAGKGLLPEGAASTGVETLLVAGDPSLGRGSETARALRAIRAGFPGRDLDILNTSDPIAALASGDARVAIAGTEAFYALGDSGPVPKGNAQAFAVLGYRSAHLFARSVGATSELLGMKTIVTDQPGSGSAIVLGMLLDSLGLNEVIEVVHEQTSLADQVAGLRNGDHDGVFRMAAQGDRTVNAAMQGGGVHLAALDQWSAEGHTATYSFIRPATIPSETYPSQFVPVASVSTQYVLASPVQKLQETGEVGPGTAGVAHVVPVGADAVEAIRGALGTADPIDPAVPVHTALAPSIEVVDKSLPFSLDVSIINILMIAFTVWVLYVCFLPSPRRLTMPDDD